MDDILDGGTTVERTSPPFPEDRHIYYDDAVYVLSHEIIEQTPATSYQIRVDIVQGTVVESEAVTYSSLQVDESVDGSSDPSTTTVGALSARIGWCELHSE